MLKSTIWRIGCILQLYIEIDEMLSKDESSIICQSVLSSVPVLFLILYPVTKMGRLAVLDMSHMNGVKLIERTKEQTK